MAPQLLMLHIGCKDTSSYYFISNHWFLEVNIFSFILDSHTALISVQAN
jgi:hypothetical protein